MPDNTDVGYAPAPISVEQVRDLYEGLRGANAARNGELIRRANRYFGQHWGDDENPLPSDKRYALTVNYIRPTVNKAVEMLVGQMPAIQVVPPGTDEAARELAEQEEALLYLTWDLNRADRVFKQLAHNMVLLRQGVAYYWWDPVIERVRFRSISPLNYFPLYDGEDIVEAIAVSRRLTKQLQRQYPDLAGRISSDAETDALSMANDTSWLTSETGVPDTGRDVATVDYTTVLDYYDRDGNWMRVMGNAVHHQNLGYGTGRVPFVEFKNNLVGDERESTSDVDDILELNLYLDQLLSQQADIIKKYHNPTVVDYGSGQDPQTVRRTIQSEGAVLPARKDSRLEYLNWQGTPPAIGEQYERVLAHIYDLSGKPAASFGQTVTNQSGVVTNMALSPTVASSTYKESLFGTGLIELNESILALYEKFMKGQGITGRAMGPSGRSANGMRFYEVQISGDQIAGWYKNRIKWPSTLRTDDPVFVQNELQKMASDPPAQSVYTTLENLGIEDVEAELDRIQAQLEDPRMHPDRLKAAVDAIGGMAGAMPPELGVDPASMNAAAESAGNPNRSALVDGV